MAEEEKEDIGGTRYTTVQEKVAEKISQCGDHVQHTIIDALATIEINKRVTIAQAAHKAIGSARSELNKIGRPELKTFDRDGKITEVFSEQRFNDLKKKRKALGELEAAFDKALNDNTADAYDKLNQLSSNSGGGGEKGSSKE